MADVVVHTSFAQRVLVGAGARHSLVDEVDRLGAKRVFVISTRSAGGAVHELTEALGLRLGARWGRAVVHTPVEVTEEAVGPLSAAGCDLLLALGGGSATGLSKALSARTGLPQIVVPTTYAGSEVTPTLGETSGGVKTTRRDPALVPGTVVYDPELTVSMPTGLTLTSAMNALAHAIEALWAPDATMVTDALATESVDALLAGLPAVLADPGDVAARGRLQEAAWLAGLCLAQTRMGLHHQLAHALGGTFDLPHAELHAMLLPHVMAFDLPFAPHAEARLVRTVGPDPVAVVRALAAYYDGPRTLRDLGVPHDGLAAVAERVVAEPYPNPRPLVLEEVAALLDEAWAGR